MHSTSIFGFNSIKSARYYLTSHKIRSSHSYFLPFVVPSWKTFQCFFGWKYNFTFSLSKNQHKYFLFTCMFHHGVKSIHFLPGMKLSVYFTMKNIVFTRWFNSDESVYIVRAVKKTCFCKLSHVTREI